MKDTGIIIREAVPEDSAAIAEICALSLGYACTDEFVRGRLASLGSDRERVFTADAGGTPIGFIHAEKYELLYAGTLVNILGLAVSEEYRRRGVGRLLMRAAEQWAADIGAEGIRLNSGGGRTEAHAFYRAAGFDSEKVQIRFIKYL